MFYPNYHVVTAAEIQNKKQWSGNGLIDNNNNNNNNNNNIVHFSSTHERHDRSHDSY